MRTVRCNSPVGPEEGTAQWGVCLLRVSACRGEGCLPSLSKGVSGTPHPPVDRILDPRLWKYYFSATSFADGKNISSENVSLIVRV